MHCKGIVIKIVRCWHKNRTSSSKEYNRNPRNKSMHRQMWFTANMALQNSGGRIVLPKNGTGTIG